MAETDRDNSEKLLAPWPLIDRYPTVLGSNLSLSYLSAAYRQAQVGYRREYVDVLDELLERDPHTYAVLQQRILTAAGGRIEVVQSDRVTKPSEDVRAHEIADWVDGALHQIEGLHQAVAALLWAIFYGVSAAEIVWERGAAELEARALGWRPRRLSFIHSRRIAYPDQSNWDVHIWDQGSVSWPTAAFGAMPTERLYGLAVKDYPGKFVVHVPQLRGDYPTRDGVGREVAYWSAIKGMAARVGAQYVERFAKPWPIGRYATQSTGTPRAATKEDIALSDSALKALGTGSLSGATIPDSIALELFGPGVGEGGRAFTPTVWADFCDKQISKAVLGQSDTTDAGPNGSRAAVSTRKEGTLELLRYDAACLADTLTRDLLLPITYLNFPSEPHLAPRCMIHVAERPDPEQRARVVERLVNVGMPVDADALADELGIRLVHPGDEQQRRLAPVKQVDVAVLNPSTAPPTPEPLPVLSGNTDDEAEVEAPPAVN